MWQKSVKSYMKTCKNKKMRDQVSESWGLCSQLQITRREDLNPLTLKVYNYILYMSLTTLTS